MGNVQAKVEATRQGLETLMADSEFVYRSGIRLSVRGPVNYPIVSHFAKVPILFEHNTKVQQIQQTCSISWKSFALLLHELVMLKSLLTIKETEDALTQEICGITLEDHPDTVLSCSHAYHGDALDAWMTKSNLCPLCPENIKKSEEYDTVCMTREDRESSISESIRRIYELVGVAT
jgi:hypothetical protein